MAHEITQRADGTAEAMFAFTPAWHGLGTVVQSVPTSEEALKLANLDWAVGQRLVYAGETRNQQEIGLPPAEFVKIPNQFVNYREDNGQSLGIVSNNYKVIQNVEAFSFVDALCQDGVIRYESAFSVSGGRKVIIVARHPGQAAIKGDDSVVQYILFSNSHDGTEGVRIGLTTVRVVCMNTYRLALTKGGIGTLSIRHSENFEEKLSEARAVLNLANDKFAQFAENARLLADRILTREEWVQFLDVLCPIPGALDPDRTERRVKTITETRQAIEHLYYDGEKQRLPGIGETAWAAFNAVTEHVDHLPRRGRDHAARSEARFNVTQYGTGHNHKARAWKTALRLAGIKDDGLTQAEIEAMDGLEV